MGNGRRWTAAEDEQLVARYETEGPAPLAAALGRTHRAILVRAHRLWLAMYRRWSEKDDARLRLLWGWRSVTGTALELKRTPAATYQRAFLLGLPLGCPQGKEYISAAAARSGYSRKAMAGILARAKVEVRGSMTLGKAGRRASRHVVDPIDVDDAIAAHMATETVSPAAWKRGVAAEKLQALLEQAGHRRPARRCRWLVPTKVIDDVVTAYRARAVSATG